MTTVTNTASAKLRAIDFAALGIWLAPVAIAYALEIVRAI